MAKPLADFDECPLSITPALPLCQQKVLYFYMIHLQVKLPANESCKRKAPFIDKNMKS